MFETSVESQLCTHLGPSKAQRDLKEPRRISKKCVVSTYKLSMNFTFCFGITITIMQVIFSLGSIFRNMKQILPLSYSYCQVGVGLRAAWLTRCPPATAPASSSPANVAAAHRHAQGWPKICTGLD